MTPHEYESLQVLNLVDVLLGVISGNFRAVSIRIEDGIVLHFLLEHESAEDREEIDYLAFELDAKQSESVRIVTEIVVSSHPVIEVPGRLVFLRRCDEFDPSDDGAGARSDG